jgi:aminoglycoside 3-N-acetyltransferase I
MRLTRLRRGQEARLLSTHGLVSPPPNARAVRAYLADDRNLLLIAREGTRVVGLLRGTELGQLKSTRRQMFLYEIGVAREYRRRGVGAQLIRWLLDYCRRRGFEEVFVLTTPSNRAAVRLYRSTGACTETPSDRMFVYRLIEARRSRGRVRDHR